MQRIQFQKSQQYTKWMMTEHELTEIYKEKEKAYQKLKLQLDKEKEEKISSYYINQLQKIIQKTGLPIKVKGTAFTYLKRYFLKKTLFTSNPQQIAFVCLYLACKVEEINDTVIIQLSQRIQEQLTQHSLIHYGNEKYRDLELQVLKILDYDLNTKNVYQIFESLAQSLDHNKFASPAEHSEILQEMYELAKISFYQTLIFQFSHGVIAQAIMKVIQMKKKNFLFIQHLQDQFINVYQNIDFENIFTQKATQLLLEQINKFKFDYLQDVKKQMTLIREAQRHHSHNKSNFYIICKQNPNFK